MTLACPTCVACGGDLPPPERVTPAGMVFGRPRRTCSARCRLAIHRLRTATTREAERQELESLRARARKRSPLLSSESVEWYTPPELFDYAVSVFGPFDLDPAADPRSPIWALVERHWTVDDDGLAQPWVGRVWCNPPYGRQIKRWTEKATAEWKAGRASVVVLLVPARPDTRWWNAAIDAGAVPVFLRGRVKFLLPDGTRLAGAPFPSALLVFRCATEVPSGGA